MQLDFLSRAYLASFGVSLLSGPLGTLMVWRRLAYLGDTLGHASLLGVAFSLLIKVNMTYGMGFICLTVAALSLYLSKTRYLSSDTILGILSHSALAGGLVALGYVQGLKLDVVEFLFGDILSISLAEIGLIYGAALVVWGLLYRFWRPLLACLIHEELAHIEGIPVNLYNKVLVLGLALILGLTMRCVGALLITALMIIPAAAARYWARGPSHMMGLATSLAALSCVGGLYVSTLYDWPSGPAMILTASTGFSLSLITAKIRGGD